MEIEKLKIGMIIKNYKALCELLGEEVKDGGSKRNQLKWYEEYFKFHKKGNSFIIDEIYVKEVSDMVDNRGKSAGSRSNNIAEYTKNIEVLILNLLAQRKQGYGKIFLSKNQLLKALKMINQNYAFCKQRMPKLSQFMNISKETVEEWYNSTSNTLERNLETALKKLENRALILWSREITVVKVVPVADVSTQNVIIKMKKKNQWDEEVLTYKTDDKTILSHREGTEEEKKFILHTERDKLVELGFKDKSEVIGMGMWEVFMNKVSEILLKECGIAYYYKSYKILFNEDHILKATEDLSDYILDEEVTSQEEYILNNGVQERLYNNIVNRQSKAISEADKIIFGEVEDPRLLRRIAKRYIEDNDMLTTKLIVLETKDIKKKVREQVIS